MLRDWHDTCIEIRNYYEEYPDHVMNDKFKTIIDEWDCKYENAEIDIIDVMFECFEYSNNENKRPPEEDLDIVYKKIRSTNKPLDYKMSVFSDIPIYINAPEMIKHFLDCNVGCIYHCLFLQNVMKDKLQEHYNDNTFLIVNEYEYIQNLVMWNQLINIKLAEILCEEFYNDIDLVYSKKDEYLQTANGAKFFEDWCELTNKRLDHTQQTLNNLSNQIKLSESEYVQAKWVEVCNDFYKLTNLLVPKVYQNEYSWVQKHKNELYHESISFITNSHFK